MAITSSITFFLPRLTGLTTLGAALTALYTHPHRGDFPQLSGALIKTLLTPLVQPNQPIFLNNGVTITILPILARDKDKDRLY